MSNLETTHGQTLTYKDIARGKITQTIIILLVIFMPLTLFQILTHESWLTGTKIQSIFTMVVMFVGTGFYTQLDKGIDWVLVRNAALVYFAIAILLSAFLSIVFIDESLIGIQLLMVSSLFVLGMLKTIDLISKSPRLKTITAVFIIFVTLALTAYSYFYH